MPLTSYSQSLTVVGRVVSVDPINRSFKVKARSGDMFDAIVGSTTSYQVLTNLDMRSRDAVEDPSGVKRDDGVAFALQKYVVRDRPVVVNGIYQEDGDQQRYPTSYPPGVCALLASVQTAST